VCVCLEVVWECKGVCVGASAAAAVVCGCLCRSFHYFVIHYYNYEH
jgi:hypothetical protein